MVWLLRLIISESTVYKIPLLPNRGIYFGTFAVSNNTTKTERWYLTVATVYVDGVSVGTQSFPAKTSATYTIELPEPIIGKEIKIAFNRNMYYSWQYSVTAAGKYAHGCAFYCMVSKIDVDYEELE